MSHGRSPMRRLRARTTAPSEKCAWEKARLPAGRSGIVWMVGLTLGLSACGASESGVAWAGTVRDSAGVRMVHNPAEGMWAAGEEWSVREVFTLGADSMGLPYQFGRVTDLDVGPDGSIFVLEGMAPEIRVFDASGTHVRTMGRAGEGPGEFGRGVAGVFVTADGRIGVPDMGNSRVNWLGLQGESLGSQPASYASGFPVRWDDDGSGEIVVQRRAMGSNEDPVLASGEPLVRFREGGEEARLLVLPLARTVRMEGAAARFTYFETEPSWDLGPSGMLRTAMTKVYRIEIRNRDGTLHTVVSKEATPRSVTESDKAHFAQLMREALTRRGTAPDAVGRFIDRLEFAATFPAFNQIMEGPDGTTLVQQIQVLSEMTMVDLAEEQSRRLGSPTWDVFDASGRFLGSFDLPSRFTPMVWESSAVYGRWLDDLDRHHVMKLELVRPARSPS